jgi:hypothetical protein
MELDIPLPASLLKRRTRDWHHTLLPSGGNSGCFWKSGSPGYTFSSSTIVELYSLPSIIDPDVESLLVIVSPKPPLSHSLILRSDVTNLASIRIRISTDHTQSTYREWWRAYPRRRLLSQVGEDSLSSRVADVDYLYEHVPGNSISLMNLHHLDISELTNSSFSRTLQSWIDPESRGIFSTSPHLDINFSLPTRNSWSLLTCRVILSKSALKR